MYLLFLEVLELLLLLFWYFLFILRLLEFPAISWLVLPAPSAFWCVALFIVLIALVLLSTLSTKHFRYTVSVTFPKQNILKFFKHYFRSGWSQTLFLKKTEKFVFLKIFVFLSKTFYGLKNIVFRKLEPFEYFRNQVWDEPCGNYFELYLYL